VNNIKSKIQNDEKYEIIGEDYFEWKIKEWNKCKKEICYSPINKIGDYNWYLFIFLCFIIFYFL